MFNIETEKELDRLTKLYQECQSSLEYIEDYPEGVDEIELNKNHELWFVRQNEVKTDIVSLLTSDEDFVDNFIELKECYDNENVWSSE